MIEQRIEIKGEGDVLAARQAGRNAARQIGFGLADQTRLTTAISELTRNVIQYAGTGSCTIADESNQERIRLQVVVEDNGPGIPDVDQVMQQGFSTGRGLGAGLPGTRRLVSDFSIHSEPGHTKVSIAIVRQRA